MSKTLTINGVSFTLLTGKKGEALSYEYRRAQYRGVYSLRQAYGRWSDAKERAYNDCNKIRDLVDGTAMYIGGWNSCVFTLLYTLQHEGVWYVVKETACNRFIAKAIWEEIV